MQAAAAKHVQDKTEVEYTENALKQLPGLEDTISPSYFKHLASVVRHHKRNSLYHGTKDAFGFSELTTRVASELLYELALLHYSISLYNIPSGQPFLMGANCASFLRCKIDERALQELKLAKRPPGDTSAYLMQMQSSSHWLLSVSDVESLRLCR